MEAESGGSSSSFVGRAETVEALRQRLELVREGTSGVTLLVGDAGVGKSALLSEFVREIRTRGIRVLVGRAPPFDDPPPFSLLQSAIENAHDDPILRSDDDPFLGAGPMMIGFAPGLGEAEFPAPLGLEGRLLEVLGGTDARTTTTADQVLTGIADRFLEFTRHGPTVLVLEDVYRADKSSLAAVEFFVRELLERPLWIVASIRPVTTLSAVGRARLDAFETATHAGRIELRPMTSGETTEYIQRHDPSRKISPEEVARRYSESGGNPFLLQQLDRRTPSETYPEEERSSELPSLDDGGRRTLDLAAVLGPEFPFDLLLRAGGEDEEQLAETVDRLVAGGFLFERPGEILEFPEDRLREEAYTLLPEKRRRILHRRAGEALEAMGEPDRPRIYALARHFYLGHDGGKSVRYNRAAAAIAERALAPDAAWDHFSRALESQREAHPDDLDGESELVLELSRITEELGLLQDAEGILRDFLDRGTGDPRLDPFRRATLEMFLARVLTDRGEMPAAAELAQKVLDSPGLDEQKLVRIGAHHQLGQVLYYDGHYPEALAQHTEEIRLAREVGNVRILVRAQIWRVAALAMMGQMEIALAEARDVTATRDGFGSVRESAQAHLFLGDMLADSRCTALQRSEAIEEYAASIRFAETAKDPRRIGWALYKTAELLREVGRSEDALEKANRAIDLFGRIGDQVGLSMSLKVRAQIAMDQGALDRAAGDLAQSYRMLQGLKHTLEEIDVVLRLAQLSYLRGDEATARQHVTELAAANLVTVRPDLEREFERLRTSLGSATGKIS
ncbi:MAG: AAA family ATPase [Thermoplasmata archaeon]|nr:AAA family ATPase [Thermoplasmata archaeon]